MVYKPLWDLTAVYLCFHTTLPLALYAPVILASCQTSSCLRAFAYTVSSVGSNSCHSCPCTCIDNSHSFLRPQLKPCFLEESFPDTRLDAVLVYALTALCTSLSYRISQVAFYICFVIGCSVSPSHPN